MRFKGADTAFAEDHLLIPLIQNVLRSQQEFLHRGGSTPLQHDRLGTFSDGLQQVVVLHVAGADLKDIGILAD